MEGKVEAVCVGNMKSQPKQEQSEIRLMPGAGVIGDAHAGTKQEVSLLAGEDVETLCHETGIKAPPGSFAENILTRGIRLVELNPGARLRLGEAEIEVIAIGKDLALSHTYSFRGLSLLPTRGVFARVVRGGTVTRGNLIHTVALNDSAFK